MKKILAFILAALMMLTMVACGETVAPVDTTTEAPADTTAEESAAPKYKIGIITGTVSQGEEEYQAAVQLKEKYPDIVVTATYPDNFSSETEQTIATVTNMAADPDVKAIIFVQAVPGATAAIEKVKETRDDILFVTGVCAEDPAVIAAAADICMLVDEISMGRTIIEQAKAMGAETFVHVSFERHLGYATIGARRDLFEKTCNELGIKYVEATAPDPTGDAGVTGAQAWITENIKVYVDQYGKNTAFFSTNCSMQEPLILQCAELGAIFPQQCCPSPYHGYPSAFAISTEGHEGDVEYMLGEIAKKVKEYGNEGRMSTWGVAVNMTMIEAGYNYAVKYCEGQTNGKLDEEVFFGCLKELAGEDMTISKYQEGDKTIENFYMLLCPFYNF